MKSFRLFVCAIVLLSSLTGAQESHRRPLPEQPPEYVPPPQVRIDPAQLRHEADELARLAQSVPADVDQAARGVLPKDLDAKLKRIEKLSKRLRGEMRL